MNLFVMVTDDNGLRFNPRIGGYVKPKCVFELTKKYPIVEVRHSPKGPLAYAFWRGLRITEEEFKLQCAKMMMGVR
jgi:hypothetical protein